MSNRKPADESLQPRSFIFDDENLKLAEFEIAKYPPERKQSAVIALLYLVQKQHGGWVPIAGMDYVANLLEMPSMRVYEVATFYTMFNLQPVGKHHIQLCGTTPCWLRGSDEIKKICRKKLNLVVGETSDDKLFTLSEVECLGACANAPVVQINDDYYEDLTAENFEQLIDSLVRNEKITVGSQIGRRCSEPTRGESKKLEETE